MKALLKEILIDIFDGDWINAVLGVLLWIIFLALAGMLLYFFVWLIDSSFLDIKKAEGIVVNKYYVPAHSSTHYNMVGSVMVPTTTYYDEAFNITVEINDLEDRVELYHDAWQDTEIGDKYWCEYSNGRILNSLYIKSIWKSNTYE